MYNPETEKFYQDPSTVVDSTPDGDSVRQGFDDRATPAIEGVYNDLNILKVNGMIGVGIPATETARGIGRSATAAEVASGVTGANGPAWVKPESLAESLAGKFAYLMIGTPIYQPTTTLPVNCMWPDGSLALFSDWPQFAAKYRANGFAGMVDTSSNSANLGKFVLNSNGTGLYLPRHGGQFMRNWCPGQTVDSGRQAGSWQADMFRAHYHSDGAGGGYNGQYGARTEFNDDDPLIIKNTGNIGGAETRPSNIAQPIVIYMGNHA